MSRFSRSALVTIGFVAVESGVLTAGQFIGESVSTLGEMAAALAVVFALALIAFLAREFRLSLRAGSSYMTGHGVLAILLSALVAGVAFVASVLIAITATASLGGSL